MFIFVEEVHMILFKQITTGLPWGFHPGIKFDRFLLVKNMGQRDDHTRSNIFFLGSGSCPINSLFLSVLVLSLLFYITVSSYLPYD